MEQSPGYPAGIGTALGTTLSKGDQHSNGQDETKTDQQQFSDAVLLEVGLRDDRHFSVCTCGSSDEVL